jgi:hypothetical protein
LQVLSCSIGKRGHCWSAEWPTVPQFQHCAAVWKLLFFFLERRRRTALHYIKKKKKGKIPWEYANKPTQILTSTQHANTIQPSRKRLALERKRTTKYWNCYHFLFRRMSTGATGLLTIWSLQLAQVSIGRFDANDSTISSSSLGIR